MPMIPPVSPSNDFEFKRIPEWQHPAIIYWVVDVGTHDRPYKWEIKKKRTVYILLEFPTVVEEMVPWKGEEPHKLTVNYTYSLNKKANLRNFVHSILGKAISDEEAEVFDMESLIGRKILANVAHVQSKTSDDVYTNIVSCMPLPDVVPCPPLINDKIIYTVESHNEFMFQKLSENMKKKIQSSDEMGIG